MTVDEAVQLGWDHFRAGRLTEAESVARQVLQAQPDAIGGLQLLGALAAQVNKWSTSLELYGRVCELPGGVSVETLCGLGQAYQGLKRDDEALECFAKAIELNATHALPYRCRARLHYERGRWQAAVDDLRVSVGRDGTQDAAYVMLGRAYQNLGLAAEAEASYIAASHINSRSPEVYCAFGQLRRLQNRLSNARQALEHALLLQADYPEALNQLGLVNYLERNFHDAEFCFSRAAQLAPHEADTFNHLGMIAYTMGRRADAHRHYLRALQLAPDQTDVMNNLATLYIADGNVTAAIELYQRVLQVRPHFPEVLNNLGLLLIQLNQPVAARRYLQQAVEQRPSYADPYTHLGCLDQADGKLSSALEHHRKAIELNPDFTDAHNNLGNLYLALGDAAAARDCFRRVIELRPDQVTTHSNYLFSHLYLPNVSLEQLATLHQDFEKKHAAPLVGMARPFDLSHDPERRLRVGFVSADLGRHPIGHLLTHMLAAVNREQFSIVLYSQRFTRDSITERIAGQVEAFREVVSLDDNQLAEQIRADKIDILIDLSGHTAANRLLVFARRPAPVQATWMGYPATTGMKAMDYIIADRFHIPPEHDRWFSERVMRLAEGTASHEIPAGAPEVNELPATEPGRVMLASFNNPAKLNADVIRVWSRVLERLPNARLRLKYLGLGDALPQQRIRDLFTSHGVDASRIEFRDRTSLVDMLREYHEVDLALDPFPYTGGTSTILALQMGVPVVTWPGETFASRQSFSLLSNLGVTETIARDADDYVEIVARLAHDLPRLAELRRSLRGRFLESCYGDAERFMNTFLPALRQMWRDWCRS
ncbi:MAG: tetratricopeptide repeat protein [Planctomycetaceae bacterium]|nr:tetratricopeptide repeat protein [Planctomycetaceae bacterium]